MSLNTFDFQVLLSRNSNRDAKLISWSSMKQETSGFFVCRKKEKHNVSDNFILADTAGNILDN